MLEDGLGIRCVVLHLLGGILGRAIDYKGAIGR